MLVDASTSRCWDIGDNTVIEMQVIDAVSLIAWEWLMSMMWQWLVTVVR